MEKILSKLSPQDRVKEGISFVPQTKNVFAGMTVEENLEMGAFLIKEDYQNTIDEIYGLFPILKEKRNQLVGELSGGQRQQVALGRALMIKPSVLMLMNLQLEFLQLSWMNYLIILLKLKEPMLLF